jgi:glutathione S-transferase
MDKLSLHDPLFATYVIAATRMILKAVGMAWLTVVRMMQAKGGFRSPEDLKKTPLNPEPHPAQLAPNERVERIRRIQMNDLENLPFFLVAGFLYILTQPPLLLAQWLLYGYVVSRLLHFAAYFTGQIHDIRAACWTVGSLILIFLTVRTLLAARMTRTEAIHQFTSLAEQLAAYTSPSSAASDSVLRKSGCAIAMS